MRCAAHGMEACEHCYAKGGEAHMKGVHRPLGETSGNSAAGQATRSHASAGPHTGRRETDKARAMEEHRRVLAESRAMPRGESKTHMADGGIVERIMEKRAGHDSMGNDDVPMADEMSADYDELDQMPEHHEADYTGENSGDMDGDELDEGRDMVTRIMRKRRQHNPVPA